MTQAAHARIMSCSENGFPSFWSSQCAEVSAFHFFVDLSQSHKNAFMSVLWAHTFSIVHVFLLHFLMCCVHILTEERCSGKRASSETRDHLSWKFQWISPANQKQMIVCITWDCLFHLVSGSLHNTICFCLYAVKTRFLGWEIHCLTFRLLWTKISLTSKSKRMICFSW